MVWQEWEITELLGEGSYGKVYKAVKKDFDVEMFSAVKIITIPKSQAELKALGAEGMSANESRSYLKGIVDNFVNEIKMMISLSGTANIVNVYDYKVFEKTEEIGWEIYIRMELLQSFEDHITSKAESGDFTDAEIIKIGTDICSALEVCAKQNPPIIHRDIKPGNIFITRNGDFKLGDFGVAREIEKSKGAYSQAGTPLYMAPEVNTGVYGIAVDICSLGLVLYRLANNSRLPFCDPYSKVVTHYERHDALQKRFKGEKIPAPVNAGGQLAQVILKACAYDPDDRFRSATEFKEALIAAGQGRYVQDSRKTVSEPLDITVAARRAQPAPPAFVPPAANPAAQPQKINPAAINPGVQPPVQPAARPVQPPPPPNAHHSHARPNNAKKPSAALAIASMILGIASLLCCGLMILPSFAGGILGIMSLLQNKGGKGMAIAGIITSAVALLAGAVLWLVIIIEEFA